MLLHPIIYVEINESYLEEKIIPHAQTTPDFTDHRIL